MRDRTSTANKPSPSATTLIDLSAAEIAALGKPLVSYEIPTIPLAPGRKVSPLVRTVITAHLKKNGATGSLTTFDGDSLVDTLQGVLHNDGLLRDDDASRRFVSGLNSFFERIAPGLCFELSARPFSPAEESCLKSYAADLSSAVRKTDLQQFPILSARLGHTVLIKREDQQAVKAFKIRGAYYCMQQLSAEERSRGVVAASAGNHGQAVPFGASLLGTTATIVMPVTTPQIKVDAVRRFGGKVVLFGDTFDAAAKHAQELEQSENLTYIHPFNDEYVIAGQGTLALEILEQHPGPIDVMFLQIGGGGLAAGVAAVIKHLRPEIKLIGVEPVGSDSMSRSIRANGPQTLEYVDTFADGLAVKTPGKLPLEMCKAYLDGMILVSDEEIAAAMNDIHVEIRVNCEPAGATSLAGLLKYAKGTEGKHLTMVAVLTGANIDYSRVAEAAKRVGLGQGHEVLLRVGIPERPGSLKDLCEKLSGHSITEFNYRGSKESVAKINMALTVRDRLDADRLISALSDRQFQVTDFSDNALVKDHLRDNAGGLFRKLKDERVYDFIFPERPGALMKFLSLMDPRWNISLFRYKKSGGDYAKVLIGIQVPLIDEGKWTEFLQKLGYTFRDETGNAALKSIAPGEIALTH